MPISIVLILWLQNSTMRRLQRTSSAFLDSEDTELKKLTQEAETQPVRPESLAPPKAKPKAFRTTKDSAKKAPEPKSTPKCKVAAP